MIKYFSILIPTLNSASTLERCLNSINSQLFQNYEVLILDGGSLDETSQIVSKFQAQGLKQIYFLQNKDLGVYDAMNSGINYAKGDWLYFLGSDDLFFDDQVLFNIWKFTKKTSRPIIYGNVFIKGNSGWAKDGEIYSGEFSKNRMLVKVICHQSIFYKREFIKSNLLYFDLKYFVSADWKFNLSCRRLSKFEYVDLTIAVFTAGGISSNKSDSFPDQIKLEFYDLYPTKLEIYFRKIIKKIIHYVR